MTRYILHKYVLPHRIYEIKTLTENRDEWIIDETYYLFGISIWNFWIGADSKLGLPFNNYEDAKSAKEKLEYKEAKAAIDREVKFIWISVGALLLGGLIKFVL